MADHTGEEATDLSEKTVRGLSVRWFLVLFVGSAIILLALSWLLLDEPLQNLIASWLATPEKNVIGYSAFVVGILASDLVLPIPSSALLTHAGIHVGVVLGTVLGFVGLTLGSLIGFGLARQLGQAFSERRVSKADRELLTRLADQYGVFLIVLLRPVPILAEASVLLLGAGQMSWRQFAIWLAISNFFVALFFAGFGQWAAENGIGELTALAIGISIPLILLVCFRFVFQRALSLQK